MIKIFTNLKLLEQVKPHQMFPLLRFFINESEQNNAKFNLKQYYTIVDAVELADVIILPVELEVMQLKFGKNYFEFLELSKKTNKKIWIFSGGDYGQTINQENVITFRFGGFNTNYNNKNTHILPSFVPDPYVTFLDGIDFKPHSDKPLIGFVGHAYRGIVKYTKEYLVYLKKELDRILKKRIYDAQSFFPSSIKRYNFLRMIEKSNAVDAEIILRKKYRAGATVNQVEKRYQTSKEYFQNIFDTQYTFCMRGGGNFSVRLYETLAVGRIPIIVNTNANLPLPNHINWRKQAVLLEYNEKNKLIDKIVSFHESLNDATFKEIQKENRLIWEKYCNIEGYFVAFYNEYVNSN